MKLPEWNDAIALAGIALLLYGISHFSHAVALICAGVILMVIAYVVPPRSGGPTR